MSGDSDKGQCAHVMHGPKVGKNVVAWRRQCKRMVKGERYCWQHRAEHAGEHLRASLRPRPGDR